MKYQTKNGWTKSLMIQAINIGNNGKVSLNESRNNCVYRASDGNKCAVGCFIPDDIYHISLETRNLPYFSGLEDFLPLEIFACILLQKTHDNCQIDMNTDPRPACIKWIEENVEDA